MFAMRRGALILIVALIFVIALVPFGAYLLYEQPGTPQVFGTFQNFVTTIYVLVSFLTTLLFSLALWNIFSRLIRLCYSVGTIISHDLRIFLPSLAISYLLVPNGFVSIVSFFGWLLSFSFRFFDQSIGALFSAWQENIKSCAESSIPSDCFGRIGFGFLSAWASSLSRVYNSNQLTTDWRSLIFFLAALALSALSISLAVNSSGDDNQPLVLSKLRGIPPQVRKNFLFFLLLAVAGYLSIAAVAAIPGLQESAPASAETSPDSLKQYLDASLKATERAVSTELAQTDPFESLEQVLEPSNNHIAAGNKPSSKSTANDSLDMKLASNAPAPGSPPPVRESLVAGENQGPAKINAPQEDVDWYRTVLSNAQNVRARLEVTRKSLMEYTIEQRVVGEDQAIKVYKISNLNRKGSRETAEHFLLITRWFDQRLSSLDHQISNCSVHVTATDAAWRAWSREGQRNLTSWSGRVTQFSDERLDNEWSQAQDWCSNLYDIPPVPDRPQLGADLGPFRFVASWLLRMESLPLALIVGLLGFGLLGSACSTFVRERRDRPADQLGCPLVTDLSSVVIRGLSAAIVVFLSVEGGLAVFSSSASEPNPYVLLLTCFIGSVYSETVWAWAQRKLGENFGAVESATAKSDSRVTGSRATKPL
jgi:hypothetical protein